METIHIHIKGLVQGVGFRPHVYRAAKQLDVKGWVNNTTDGVHIIATADKEIVNDFCDAVICHPPANAHITEHAVAKIPFCDFNDFSIQGSNVLTISDLLITPDFALCEHCRKDLFDERSRRFRYPFITCTSCGPRYSIIGDLPYDRSGTTMKAYQQCGECLAEYNDPTDRRYYSQTNLCCDCGIKMYLHDNKGECLGTDYTSILRQTTMALQDGCTVAVKGIGGYLLMCDATNRAAINALRRNKHRPVKPFAVLYPNIEAAEKDVALSVAEKKALQSPVAPIVLCRLKENFSTAIVPDLVAPGLHRIGVMLPYSPLLALVAVDFQKPLIATSANVSGSPILFEDDEVLSELKGIADLFLVYDRDILIPQDDSVITISPRHEQKIILRRSRGLAPNYFAAPMRPLVPTLAMGGELKSSFAIADDKRCYISQYLGDQSSYEAQQSFDHTLKHLTDILSFTPEKILVDSHPAYFVSDVGRDLAQKKNLPLTEIQHHKAHFAAVLAENNLMHGNDAVFGVVWDGTGYGDDGNIWGGEFFEYCDDTIHRIAHLRYFPLIAGDKIAREPRLSALALGRKNPAALQLLRSKFTNDEWNFFHSVLHQNNSVQTSSMGRLLDGIAALLGVADSNSFEGEAAMRLEALAATYSENSTDAYSFTCRDNIIDWQHMITEIVDDIARQKDKKFIAYKVHYSLAKLVENVASQRNVRKIAFSGGVFQNTLLVDLLIDLLHEDYGLFFHQQLSPNDECISFGQLAYQQIVEESNRFSKTSSELLVQSTSICV